MRIPNKFKGSGLIGKGYSHKYKEVTWAIGEPDPSAGYTETRVSWKSDWQATAEDPVVSWRTENDVGTVTFLNDVVINGSVAFSKGPARYYSGMEIGHRCYSSLDDDGISSNCYGLEQFVFNSDTDLYYTFVKAANDSNAIILWGIFSTSSRYANQSNNMSTGGSSQSASAKTSQTTSSGSWTAYANAYAFPYNDESVHTYTLLVPNNYNNGFKNSRGEYQEIANPTEDRGYTTLKFKAYVENDRKRGEFWMHFEDSVSFLGKVVFPVGDFAQVDKKDETSFYYDEDLSFWPDYIQSLYSSEDKRIYYFVRSKSDPYTIILWGVQK